MATLGLVGTAATASAGGAAAGAITATGWSAIGLAVSAASTAYTSSQMDSGRQDQLSAPQIDKQKAQEAEKLDSIEIGDEESRKRKKQASKTKFKTDLIKPPATTGINIGGEGKIQGVQI